MNLFHRDIDALRRERGRSLLLFISDRCPVGCAHCSVDSRPDGPTITDLPLFKRIVEWIASDPRVELVEISGGEPFVEREGLCLATRQLAAAGKRVVVFTSGIWAARERIAGWVRDVLGRCDSVYLSTDAFHAETIDDECLIHAAREIAAADARLVLQVLDHGPARKRAAKLLNEAFGGRWDQLAEINVIPPQRHGRGADLFAPLARIEGHAFGPCTQVGSPVVRYDGVVSACANESVIMGRGPARLRKAATTTNGLSAALRRFQSDPLLRVIGDSGLGVLTEHPRAKELGTERFSTNCELCWKLLERLPEGGDRLIEAIDAVGQG